jgi:hypothetical protein
MATLTNLVATTATGDLVQSTFSDRKLESALSQLQINIDATNASIAALSKRIDALESHKQIAVTTNDIILLQRAGTSHCLDGGMNGWDYHQWPCNGGNGYQRHHIKKVDYHNFA